MTTIKILPEILSNKIAAGEVVERPASVVKELVENALDAGSSRIVIEVENGGRSLLRVADNGGGMTRDDALLAIERYATSKLQSDADLFQIRTLGFRGEALPSIAAVSRFTLVTRHQSADAGTGIYIEGGRLKRVTDEGAPVGTMISVRQLFFNTPARRKFMKTTATEMGHITDTVATIALACPDVHFRLLHNRKPVKQFAAADPALRAADVLGKELSRDLHNISFKNDGISISGWISAPRVTRSTAQGIYVYVNGRPVRDRVIQHALLAGYGRRLMKGRFPVAVLFIAVPFSAVDVNVHPTKHEVRFVDPNRVHDALETAAAAVLERTGRPQWLAPRPAHPPKPVSVLAEATARFDTAATKNETAVPAARRPPEKPLPHDRPALFDRKQIGDLRVIGQFHGTYVLCDAGSDLVLIDQHAAHERIRFEQLIKQAAADRKDVQKLLLPQTVELDHRQAAALQPLIPELETVGLELEPFGGNTVVVKALPAMLVDRAPAALVRELAETLAEIGIRGGLQKAMEDCLVVMACHGTIRANQPLSPSEMQHLVYELARCEDPSHCPHGRPTWVRWKIGIIEKLFGRIG